jgi:hypothetical protein
MRPADRRSLHSFRVASRLRLKFRREEDVLCGQVRAVWVRAAGSPGLTASQGRPAGPRDDGKVAIAAALGPTMAETFQSSPFSLPSAPRQPPFAGTDRPMCRSCGRTHNFYTGASPAGQSSSRAELREHAARRKYDIQRFRLLF